MSLPAWVETIRRAAMPREGGVRRVLVVCRTQPQVREMLRGLAESGGVAGVLVTGLRGLALSTFPKSPWAANHPEEAPLPDCDLARLIRPDGVDDPRPGLEMHLAALVRAVRLTLSAEATIPEAAGHWDDVVRIAGSGWGRDDEEIAMLSALERLDRSDAGGTPVPFGFHVAFSVGFGPGAAAPEWECALSRKWCEIDAPPTPVGAWERRMIERLGAKPLFDAESQPPGLSLEAIRVPDVSAEARLATSLLIEAEKNRKTALVLVPDAQSSARLRETAERNGLAVSGTTSVSYAAHDLAPLLRETLYWFAPCEGTTAPDPAIRASALARVLSSAAIRRAFPRDAEARLREALRALHREGEDDELSVRLTARDARDAIGEAHIGEAPLSGWLARFEELAEGKRLPRDAQGEETRIAAVRRRAILMAERLRRLRACIAGEPFDASAAKDAEAPFGIPAPGTLGALHRFVVDCGVDVQDDHVGQALLGDLRSDGEKRAGARELSRILNGRSSGREIARGVCVMTYADYDGRATDRLFLLGCHTQGLAAAPEPDPVLGEEQLAHLGVLKGRRAIAFRLLQALRAVANAGSAIAVVSERDSSGRRVVPPVQLSLRFGNVDRLVDSFGHGLSLPETARHQALERVSRPDSEKDLELPERSIGGGEESFIAVQASVEWYRAGRGLKPLSQKLVEYLMSSSENRGPPLTLVEHLELHAPLGPAWTTPYLGEVGDLSNIEWAKHPLRGARPWSVSTDFEAATNCLYRYFVAGILRVEGQEEIGDEPDEREAGSAIHRVFERANPKDGPGVRWRVEKEEDVEVARREAVEILSRLTDEEIAGVIDEMGFRSDSAVADRRGLGARWREHWKSYAAARIHAAGGKARNELLEDWVDAPLIRGNPLFPELFEGFFAPFAGNRWSGKKEENKRKDLLPWLVDAVRKASSGRLRDLDDEALLKLSPKAGLPPPSKFKNLADALRRFTEGRPFAAFVDAVGNDVASRSALIEGCTAPIAEVLTEVSFGESGGGRAGPDGLALDIGPIPLRVRGRIDRIALTRVGDETMAELLDYKTGFMPSDIVEKMQTLQLPQLSVYALVAQKLGHRVASIGYDYVKRDGDAGAPRLLTPPDLLARFEHALGALLGELLAGRFWCMPLADAAYKDKGSWGYSQGKIDLRDACRFENVYEPAGLSEAEQSGEEQEVER